jgi:hypothetical protein
MNLSPDIFESFEAAFERMNRRMGKYVIRWNNVIDQRLFDLVKTRWMEVANEADTAGDVMVTYTGIEEDDSESTHEVPLCLPLAINLYLDELGVPDVPEEDQLDEE